jgi:hypothetical protein
MTPVPAPPQWCMYDDFPDSCDVRIGFKTIDDENETEHWMNRLSVNWTRQSDDISPGGTICHAEIMLHVREGEWRRWSIAKASRVKGRDGRERWVPGTVHCKMADVMNDDYTYIKFVMGRREQFNVFNFLMSQVGGGFNLTGYVLNFILPFGGVGTARHFEGIAMRRRRWFCTELITCALQAGDMAGFRRANACRMSPNALYRACARVSTAMAALNPAKHTTIVL